MYKIGEFSKLSRLSVKTLRYYAQIGLLEPAFTDEYSGYRYYSVKQLQDVKRIYALKEMGFSLEEIRDCKDDVITLLEQKKQELYDRIEKMHEQIKKLETSEILLQREEMSMFHVSIKQQSPISVSSIRQIFSNREEVMTVLQKQLIERNCKQAVIINYENEYCSSDLDMEIAFLNDKGEKNILIPPEIPGYNLSDEQTVASLVCEKQQLDEAYSYLVRYLHETGDYQIIGDTHEWYVDNDTIELMIPVHKLGKYVETPVSDDINVPFENDNDVIGHWKTVCGCVTKEGFNPLHNKWKPEDGDIRDIYFLPQGERYWCFGWTKGYLLSRFSVPVVEGKNPYQINRINGKKYLFVWFKDRDCFHKGALPTLIVLEQVDSKKYKKDELRIRDEMTNGFETDKSVVGKWKVCDFVREPDKFVYNKYNAGFSKDKLYFKHIYLEDNGKCEVMYGENVLKSPRIDWTNGYVREHKEKLMQKYERRIIERNEYLFVQFKSGDYFYNHQEPWWYVFTRIVEV